MKSLPILVVSGCVVHFAAGRFLWLVCLLFFAFCLLSGSVQRAMKGIRPANTVDMFPISGWIWSMQHVQRLQCFAAVSCFQRRDVIAKSVESVSLSLLPVFATN